MATTVNDLIKKLQSLKPELREKKVVIRAENGLLLEPEIKQVLKDPMNVFGGVENVESMILTY